MKILLHSNGPNAPTGYGVQTAQLARRLRDSGHEVAISVYWGHQTGLGEWEGVPLLPCAGESYGNDILPEHALKWFDKDPLGGWIIPIMDVFGLTTPALSHFNIAAWTPVDHVPAPIEVGKFFVRTGAVPVAMSKWGEERLRDDLALDAKYAPLAVDTSTYRPVADAKTVCGLSDDRFVVMMNGMNKGWALHRKGYPEAMVAFAQFAQTHPDALLYIHAEQFGNYAQGINLVDLAQSAGIPDHQIVFCDQYAYRCGFIPPEQLAAVYSAADVLLAPSRGEGFCIPLIEAQACGTPVIVTDFSAQPELVGAGWKVPGQPEWEAAQTSWVVKADIPAIAKALESAYEERGSETNAKAAVAKAQEYDADLVFSKHWEPILAELVGEPVDLARKRIPKSDGVAVIVPAMKRPQNVKPLVDSFNATQRGVATLYFVCDVDDAAQIEAVTAAGAKVIAFYRDGLNRPGTYAEKANAGFKATAEPWVFVCGDDVRFHKGWIDAARDLSDRFDVIGTNDHPDRRGNPRVANGSHADHFFVRRAYVDEYGGSLSGDLFHEGYKHFYSDVELIELAKARGVWSPCLASLVEHLHPDLGHGEPDDTYRLGWAARSHDEAEWLSRRNLVEAQSQGLGKVREA